MSPNINADSHTYDTGNAKSDHLNTLETLPHVDHYRNLLSAGVSNIKKRPTLVQLHEMEEYDPAVDGEVIMPDDKQTQVREILNEIFFVIR